MPGISAVLFLKATGRGPFIEGMEWDWTEQDKFFGYARAKDAEIELAVLFLSGRLFCYWQRKGDHSRLGPAEVWQA